MPATNFLKKTFNIVLYHDMNLFMRKPAFCICENKDADQLRGNREAGQRLCFRCMDSTIPLLPKSEISSFCACAAWFVSYLVGNPEDRVLTTRLICPYQSFSGTNILEGKTDVFQELKEKFWKTWTVGVFGLLPRQQACIQVI